MLCSCGLVLPLTKGSAMFSKLPWKQLHCYVHIHYSCFCFFCFRCDFVLCCEDWIGLIWNNTSAELRSDENINTPEAEFEPSKLWFSRNKAALNKYSDSHERKTIVEQTPHIRNQIKSKRSKIPGRKTNAVHRIYIQSTHNRMKHRNEYPKQCSSRSILVCQDRATKILQNSI